MTSEKNTAVAAAALAALQKHQSTAGVPMNVENDSAPIKAAETQGATGQLGAAIAAVQQMQSTPATSVPPAPPVHGGTVSTEMNFANSNQTQEATNPAPPVPVVQQPKTLQQLRWELQQAEKAEQDRLKAEETARYADGRVFYCRMPNSTFYAQKKDEFGKPLQGQVDKLEFHGHQMFVTNAEHIKQLLEIADTPGCPIYTKSQNAGTPAVDQLAFDEVRERAAEVVQQLAAAGQRA